MRWLALIEAKTWKQRGGGGQNGLPNGLPNNSAERAIQMLKRDQIITRRIENLRSIKAGGVAVQVTHTAYSQTWIQANYIVAALTY